MKKNPRLKCLTLALVLGCALSSAARADNSEDPQEAERSAPPAVTRRRVEFPSPLPSGNARNDRVVAELYAPTTPGKKPALLVLHAWRARAAHTERDLCAAAAQRGMAALLLTLPWHMDRRSPGAGPERLLGDDPLQTAQSFRQAHADAHAALDWLAQQPEVDATRLGLVGLSVGSLVGVRVLASEPRLAFGVLVLCGGGIQLLMEDSLVGHRLQSGIRRRGLDPVAALLTLRDIDPLNYAESLRDRRLLMINGLYDTVIPPVCARLLWEQLGKPELVWIPTGHLGAIPHRGTLIEEGMAFVDRVLQGKPPSLGTVRFRNVLSPKLGLAMVTNGEVRPALLGELFRFDRGGRVAFDLGVMPFRLLAGVSVNLAAWRRLGWTDLSAGIAIDRTGSGKPYFGFGFHF